jgi:exodeoxyribonuclease-3
MESAAPGYRCASSLARDPRNVTYRGGRAYGVATYVREDLGAVASAAPAWDREGRVLVTRLAGLGLSIINLYAVNGTSKPYWDHDRGEVVGDRHAFKRTVQDRLFELARGLAADGPVILAGDWNVSRTRLDVHPRLRTEEPHATARAQLEAHLAASGMVDVYRQLHPEERGYTWISRVRPRVLDAARVDYVVVSAELAGRVSEATIVEPPLDRGRSDHRVVTVTVRL